MLCFTTPQTRDAYKAFKLPPGDPDGFFQVAKKIFVHAPDLTLWRLRDLAADTHLIYANAKTEQEFCVLAEQAMRGDSLVTEYGKYSGGPATQNGRTDSQTAVFSVLTGEPGGERVARYYVGNRYVVWLHVIRAVAALPEGTRLPAAGDRINIRLVGCIPDHKLVAWSVPMSKQMFRYIINARLMHLIDQEGRVHLDLVPHRAGIGEQPYMGVSPSNRTRPETVFAFLLMYCEYMGHTSEHVENLFYWFFMERDFVLDSDIMAQAANHLIDFCKTLCHRRTPKGRTRTLDAMFHMWSQAQHVILEKTRFVKFNAAQEVMCAIEADGLRVYCNRRSMIEEMFAAMRQHLHISAEYQIEFLFDIESDVLRGEHLLRYRPNVPDQTLLILLASHHAGRAKNFAADYSDILASCLSNVFEYYLRNQGALVPHPVVSPPVEVHIMMAELSLALALCAPSPDGNTAPQQAMAYAVVRLLPLLRVLPWALVALEREDRPEEWTGICESTNEEAAIAAAMRTMEQWNLWSEGRKFLAGLFLYSRFMPCMSGFYSDRDQSGDRRKRNFPFLRESALQEARQLAETTLASNLFQLAPTDHSDLKAFAEAAARQMRFNRGGYAENEIRELEARGVVVPTDKNLSFVHWREHSGFLTLLSLVSPARAGFLLAHVGWPWEFQTKSYERKLDFLPPRSGHEEFRGAMHGFIQRCCNEFSAVSSGTLYYCRDRMRGALRVPQHCPVRVKNNKESLAQHFYVFSMHRVLFQNPQMWSSATADALWCQHSKHVSHLALAKIADIE